MKEYTYHWLHVTSKRRGITKGVWPTEKHFLRDLNKWNGAMTWKYWAEPSDLETPSFVYTY